MAGRILVLDDEENYAEMLQDLLRENSYRVDMATRPERAITQLEEIPYDLVISDYKMPVMDGADFLKKARELYPNLPFILVSGLMNTPELVKVANMSVTLVMEKPLDTEVFLQHVARFSAPMTDIEKEQFVQEGASLASERVAHSYPEEPRFFSASNFLSNRFLQNAWVIAKEARELFILESVGGDAELAIKDLSNWRGNGDMPVEVLALPDTNEAAIVKLREVLADFEKSRLIGVRINSLSDIARAHKLTELALRELEGSEPLLLVYIVNAERADTSEFVAAAAECGVVLPSLSLRPSDIAVYARRTARISAERAGRSQGAEFTPEAVYVLLSYDWPGNFKQLQEVVSAAVNASADEFITLEVLNTVLETEFEVVAPDQRIATLMKTEQCRYLKEQLEEGGLTAAELAKKLELDPSVQTKDDLYNMPLLRSELNRF
ncbi:response regulator [Coraliomargarita sp. SDUM461004]|uniref:Response regulator n=1 Tax=Thalassobacterium sedimentorum TaxID=3041258 RepID=A0ABU1AJE7_9BACT|nr:response regulator [Coraliomargarita sp. SDUM461004]MDQ8194925.1 response regulator [Coraliomargarita sp. SDUM461004]